ncbi:MAG: ABC transporter permease [Polyangiaceae bacterium]
MTPASELCVAARQLAVLVGKELRQLARDRVLLVFTVYIFSLHIVVTTMGANDDLRRAVTVVHDGDHSRASRELVQRLRPPYFTVTGEVADARAGARALDEGTASVFVDLPEDFSERLGRPDEQASVQMLVDTSQVSLGYLASAYGSRIAADYGAEVAAERLRRAGIAEPPPRIETRERTWYNFTLDLKRSFALQSLIMMMSVACVMLPATAAVREKERGTIEQLLVSPVSPLQIMLAKVVAMVLVTLAGTALAFYGVLGPVFGVPMRGSPVLFFAMVALYAFALAGLGLVLSTLSRSSGQVGLLVILTVLPMIFLSGTATPIEGMPRAEQWAIEALPLYHFVHISYGIVFRGETLASLWPSMLAVAAIGSVFFALGLWRFRKQLA